MAKRGNGEGTIRFDEQRQEWVGAIRNNGKRVFFYSGKGGKKSDVVKKMNDYRLNFSGDTSSNLTLDKGIVSWLTTVKAKQLKPASYDRLESIIYNHVIPRIGDYRVDKLTLEIISAALMDKMEKAGLSVSSRKKAYDAINAYLKFAVQQRLIPYNPMEPMVAPSDMNSRNSHTKVVDPMTVDEMKAFINAALSKYSTGRYRYAGGVPAILCMNTGLRMGELLALTWDDVESNFNEIRINKNTIRIKNRTGEGARQKIIVQSSPKTGKSNRIVPLNTTAVNMLKELSKERNGKLVVHTATGGIVSASTFERMIGHICDGAGIRHITAHTLRHTYATRLFENHVDIKIISELLGHSTTEITYKTYIHVIESLKRSAVDAIELI